MRGTALTGAALVAVGVTSLFAAEMVSATQPGSDTPKRYLLAVSHGSGLALLSAAGEASAAQPMSTTTSRTLTCDAVWRVGTFSIGARCIESRVGLAGGHAQSKPRVGLAGGRAQSKPRVGLAGGRAQSKPRVGLAGGRAPSKTRVELAALPLI